MLWKRIANALLCQFTVIFHDERDPEEEVSADHRSGTHPTALGARAPAPSLRITHIPTWNSHGPGNVHSRAAPRPSRNLAMASVTSRCSLISSLSACLTRQSFCFPQSCNAPTTLLPRLPAQLRVSSTGLSVKPHSASWGHAPRPRGRRALGSLLVSNPAALRQDPWPRRTPFYRLPGALQTRPARPVRLSAVSRLSVLPAVSRHPPQ